MADRARISNVTQGPSAAGRIKRRWYIQVVAYYLVSKKNNLERWQKESVLREISHSDTDTAVSI